MEEETRQPSYYGVLPANVRYDTELVPNAKLLYAEISALANMRGICWATNAHLAKLYGVQPTRISEWVRQLEAKGYIRTKKINGGYRGISVVANPSGKVEGGVLEKQKHNNTVTNNKSIVDLQNQLLVLVNKITGRSFRTLPDRGVKKTLDAFTLPEIERALNALVNDNWHREKLKEFKIDYLIRSTTIDKFLGKSEASPAGDAYGYRNGKKIVTRDDDDNAYWGGELITPQNQDRIIQEQREQD